MKKNKKLSIFDKMMQDPKRKEAFDEGYREFLISELLISLMAEDHVSVRKLAKEAGVSPSIIQDLRSGKRKNATVKNFSKLMHTLGAEIVVKKGRKVLATL